MRMLLHKDILTQRYFCEEIFLHGDAFTHGNASTHTHIRIFLHRDIRDEFTLRKFAHTDAITNRGASTKEAFIRGAVTQGRFYTDILLHDIRFWTPILCERVQQADAKPEFHRSS